MTMAKTQLTPAQRRLVEENYPLAKYLARLVWVKNSDRFDRDELNSVAFEGLVAAALRYDPALNPSFSGYARTRITGSIIDWQRTEDHVRRSVRADYKKLVQHGLDIENVGVPPLEVLAARAELPMDRVRTVIDSVIMSPISIDALQWDNSGDEDENPNNSRLNVSEPDRITMGAAPVNTAEENVIVGGITSGVVKTIQSLPQIQQWVVTLRYYAGYDLKVISTQLNLSQDVVRQAHADAVMEIHAAMKRSVHH